ncbi:MAG: beta-galactosidase [Acidobacteriaceae bacterium]
MNSKPALTILSAAFAVLCSAAPLSAQTPAPQPLVIDASAATSAPGPANYTYDPADASSPSGHVLSLNAEYLTLDGKPWLPVMGEMHYSRVPEAEWETEILKMKSAGVQIVSAYIIWIHHEEVEDQWDWSGQKDLRHFVELCARHGMYVVPRIGPWSHAEVRNGGFPDWLLTKTNQTRSNDPTYLHYVDLYYQQIAAQLKGLMWSEGGPVIAIQLENEYRGSGPTRGTAHILKLKELARTAGLRVPFYTVTGWDGASIPHGDVLPVYGGYPDAPWDASINQLPPSEVYNFRFGSRVTGDMGAIGGQQPTGNAANFTRDTPFMTAEMGGGMQVTYHRRPIVSADDIAAMMPVMLGSGVNLYGTYVFHGGENPDGKLTTLQESLATHYANDLPQKTYDFEAPIGEFGDERESLLKLKTWNYFLNDFGPILAPMQPHAPNVLPANARDLTVPRVASRTSGSSGFLFVNNHVRDYSMPARENFQVTIKLPGDKSVTLPSKPITLPADAYFVWPFNMDLSGLHLRYATAQPLAILGTKAAPIYVFFAEGNMPVDFVVDDVPGLRFNLKSDPEASWNQVERHDGAIGISYLRTDPNKPPLRFILPNGKTVIIYLLSQDAAEHSWRIVAGGKKHLFWSEDPQVFIDGNTAVLQRLGVNLFNADLIPSDARLTPLDRSANIRQLPEGGQLASLRDGRPAVIELNTTQIKPASSPAPLPADFKPSSRPRVVAAAPTDADWSRAATYSIPIPKSALTDTPAEQHFLRITYTGDVARLSVPIDGKDHLLDDNFADNRPWLVGLSRFTPQLQANPTLQLSIYPLRANAPIFFEPGHEPKPDAPTAVQSVELLTQYTLKLKLVPQTPHK